MMPSLLKAPDSHELELETAIDFVGRLSRIASSTTVELAAGEILFGEGQEAEKVYALIEGHLVIEKETINGPAITLAQLKAGELVGELEVWTGQVRTTTARAETAARLVEVPAATFKKWLQANPDVRQAVAALALPRIRHYQLVSVLGQLFDQADALFLQKLHSHLTWLHFANGETVFRQGETGQHLYLVINGRLRLLYQDGAGQIHPAGEVNSGEMAGEFALLSGAPYTATAVAVRETNVVALTRADFQKLGDEHPRAMLALTQIIARRQQGPLVHGGRPGTAPVTITLIPATPDVDLAAFTTRLVEELSTAGATYALTPARFDSDYGQQGAANMPPDHPAHPLLVDWMNDLESRYRYLLYVADATWTEWTRRCLRQADRVLIVANAANNPAPSLIERAMEALPIQARVELVLLHEAGVERPQGSAAWLAPRKVYAHHHVRRTTPEHYGRLARRLVGNTVSLVLSGGGARGYAHAGVFRAMKELGIPIDLVGGTSMGALGAAAIALDWDYEQMLALSERFANPKALFDYTLPLVSFFASKKLTGVIRQTMGEHQIEDLWRPFFAVSANLTKSSTHIHQSGPLWQAVRASISIPGIFTPVLDNNGDVLVDGGLINNFPIDVMRQQVEGGRIIGVHLDSGGRAKKYNFGPALSGWQVLWRRINPFTEPIAAPSLFGYLVRAAMLNSTHHNNIVKQQTDLLIEPRVQGYGLLEFEKYRDIVEIGYQSALPLLSEWWAAQPSPV